MHGLGCWFDVDFLGSQAHVTLTTSPESAGTHWYQVRIEEDHHCHRRHTMITTVTTATTATAATTTITATAATTASAGCC